MGCVAVSVSLRAVAVLHLCARLPAGHGAACADGHDVDGTHALLNAQVNAILCKAHHCVREDGVGARVRRAYLKVASVDTDTLLSTMCMSVSCEGAGVGVVTIESIFFISSKELC